MRESLFPFLESRPEGLYAPPFRAFLDPPAAVERAILSHAHSDHAVAGHAEIWATPETIALYRRRHPEWVGVARSLAYGETAEAGAARLTLFPAGHILGSAQIRFEEAGRSLLYTGDFKRRASATARTAETPASDILLTETTFGLPVFRFPPREALEERLAAGSRGGAHRAALVCPDSCRTEDQETPRHLSFRLGPALRLESGFRRRRAASDVRSRGLRGAARARRGSRPGDCPHDARLRERFRADSVQPWRSGRPARRGSGAPFRGRVSGAEEYRLLAEALEAAAQERGNLAKIERLAGALRGLSGARLAIAARLLSGSPFAECRPAGRSNLLGDTRPRRLRRHGMG